MTRHRPPRLAMSLLSRCLPEDDPLVGDLVEEFAQGQRRRSWFWRQTLAVVGRRAPRSVRIMSGLALTALIACGIAYSWALTGRSEFPEVIEQFTVAEMITSSRPNGFHGGLRLRGKVVEITGVLELVVPASSVHAVDEPRLLLSGGPQIRGYMGVWLDPSVVLDTLPVGTMVTLRCRYGNDLRPRCLVVRKG